jgi:sugar lactone lactonase YvrE
MIRLLFGLCGVCALAATIERVAPIPLTEPFGVAFDRAGVMYIIEYKGERLLKVDPQGQTAVLVEAGKLHEPHGLVIARDQKMYVADTHNNQVKVVDRSTGAITLLAGTGEKGYRGDGGPAAKASFNGIFAISLNPRGDTLLVTDLTNRRIRAIDLKTGVVSLVAGNGEQGVPADGAVAKESPLSDPRAAAADSKGNVYILERRGNALRVVDRAGKIRTVIPGGLNGPKHLCIDKNDDVIIADAENHLIKRYSPGDGKVTVIAGTGEKGDRIVADDPLKTQLNRPHGVTVHANGHLYITDSYNHRILRMARR